MWADVIVLPEPVVDDDGDPFTDAALMAWLNGDGLWEVRRGIDASGDILTLDTMELFADLAGVEGYFAAFDGIFSTGTIDDLANLYVTYAIELGEIVAFDEFTIRVTALLAKVPPVPLPASGFVLVLAFSLLAALSMRRPGAA